MGGPVDPVEAIEPIAVPFARITSVLRRHIWVILVTFAIYRAGRHHY
jgi:hypothetical protein